MKEEASLKLIWRSIAPFRRRAALVLLIVLADTALASLGIGMVLPVLQAFLSPEKSLESLSRAIPAFGAMSPQARMITVAVATMVVFLLKGAVSAWSVVTSRSFSEHLRHYWMTGLGRLYLFGPYATLQTQKQGVLLNSWFNESSVAARFFVSYLAYVSSLILTVALIILGLIVSWPAMLIFLAVAGLVMFALRKRSFGTMTRLGQLKLRLHQGISAAMAETLLHARELKILTAEPIRLSQIESSARELNVVLIRTAVLSEMPRIAGESLAVVVLLSLLVGGIVFMDANPQSLLPTLAFFFVAFYRLMTSGMQAMSARMKALADLHSLRAVQTLLDTAHTREDRESGEPIETLTTDIRFEGVSFGYDATRPVVQDLTFTLPRGRLTFLIGPSGAGKSTLLDLLMRLQAPVSGRILANGRDISEFNLLQWRRRFGYVSQEAALFNGTIRMNLLLASADATDEQLSDACRLAGAHDFIQAFPDGYDTVVGDRGYSVSGGQRKRIAIARALIMKPSVLVLDEATTSFEQTLERDMLRALKSAMPELTVIQITHRLQSATDADLVVALESGRVVAEGTWADVQKVLAASPALFASS